MLSIGQAALNAFKREVAFSQLGKGEVEWKMAAALPLSSVFFSGCCLPFFFYSLYSAIEVQQ